MCCSQAAQAVKHTYMDLIRSIDLLFLTDLRPRRHVEGGRWAVDVTFSIAAVGEASAPPSPDDPRYVPTAAPIAAPRWPSVVSLGRGGRRRREREESVEQSKGILRGGEEP